MRFFSRLNSWFGIRSNQNEKPHQQDVSLPYEYLPNSTPAIFRQIFLEILEKMDSAEQPEYFGLDPTIHLLAIPQPASQSAADRLRATQEIDGALNNMQGSGRKRSVLTWNSLKQSRPQFDSSYLTWAKNHVPLLHSGKLGIIFFIDIDAISHATFLSAQSFGFSPQMNATQLEVRVPERNFELRLSIMEIIAESIWTGRGPLAVINKRSRKLAGDFRLLNSLLSSLRRRFPELQFEVHPDSIQILNRPDSPTIDYRKVARSIRHAEVSSATWVESITIDDLVSLEGKPTLMFRSDRYLRAWPDALAESSDHCSTVAARLLDNGRIRPVLRLEGEPTTRLQYYQDEAHHTFTDYTFSLFVHLMRLEGERFAMCVLGDRAADVLLDRRLIRGLLEDCIQLPTSVDTVGVTEDFIIICSESLDAETVDAAKQRGILLSEDIFQDTADPITHHSKVNLPLQAAGVFHITTVMTSYFAYRKQAEKLETISPDSTAYMRGQLLASLGLLDKAKRFFEDALRYERDNADYLFALGQTYLEDEDPSSALPFLEKAQLFDPDTSAIPHALGRAHTALGNTTAATAALEEALRLDPQDEEILILLGRNYTENLLFSKARECLRRALTQSPGSTEAYASMAALCQRMGDTEGARTNAFAALLTQMPESENLADLKQLLDVLDEAED